MQLQTRDTKTTVELKDAILSDEYNESLVHQVITTYLSNARAGTAKQKTRSEVRGGGKKPWNQKGTGRARAGTIRSPLWRSGGVTFAATPRSYVKKLNKKMYRKALRSILAELNRQERLIVVSDFQCDSVKTKDFIKKMQTLEVSNALIVMKDLGENEYLASRNLIEYEISDAAGIDPYHLLRFENVVITVDALQQLEEQLL